MKIKIDFITNSSSSCLIICLPEDFEWKLDETLKDFMFRFAFDDEGIERSNIESHKEYPAFFKKLLDGVNTLKNEFELLQCDNEDEVFSILGNYFRNSDYYIAMGNAGEFEGSIINVKKEKINELFMILNKDLIKETSEFLEKEKDD